MTEPTLAQAAQGFGGLLAGGLDEGGTLAEGQADCVERQVHDALAQAAGRLLVAPGCVLCVDTPEDNIEAVLRAAAACEQEDAIQA